ncbi:hypothetical protein EYF80_052688 [Liparis tanakae]|uniref:Uncharacterized protein n=1 Tax=Liparis tanakae TaxID=230148 RepID=A0A4Z2F8M0_9TELE|nr:hypothetical protein EYF80_052688 [Liparis tanakae]
MDKRNRSQNALRRAAMGERAFEKVHDLPMAAGAVLTRSPPRGPARFLRSCVPGVSHDTGPRPDDCRGHRDTEAR